MTFGFSLYTTTFQDVLNSRPNSLGHLKMNVLGRSRDRRPIYTSQFLPNQPADRAIVTTRSNYNDGRSNQMSKVVTGNVRDECMQRRKILGEILIRANDSKDSKGEKQEVLERKRTILHLGTFRYIQLIGPVMARGAFSWVFRRHPCAFLHSLCNRSTLNRVYAWLGCQGFSYFQSQLHYQFVQLVSMLIPRTLYPYHLRKRIIKLLRPSLQLW